MSLLGFRELFSNSFGSMGIILWAVSNSHRELVKFKLCVNYKGNAISDTRIETCSSTKIFPIIWTDVVVGNCKRVLEDHV